jgi:4-amino-4-deoxy-L-arabinose transferase-like glycosyltransferase
VPHKLILALIVLGFLFVGVLYVVKTPDWQVPDEPAHYNYIRQLAEERRLPVLESGDYDQDYLGRLTNERFPPELSLAAVEYEDWQPPLYYLLAAPIYLLFNGALLPLRLLSLLLGAVVVLLAYAIAAAVFPDRPLIALGTAAFVAFLPQHVAMMAGVNNDSLTEPLIAVALLMILLWSRGDRRANAGQSWLLGLGVVLGLGLVTKATFLPIALTVALAILIVWWRDPERKWQQLFQTLGLVFIPAVLIAAPWWLRNIATYGGLDIYGTANHDAVVVGQPRTADWIETYGLGPWLERWVTFTFQSFWGQFGWMGVLMPTWLYRALALWSAVLGVGLGVWLWQARTGTGRSTASSSRDAARNDYLQARQGTQHEAINPALAEGCNTPLIILAITVCLVILTYVYYNRTFVQHQGRYLFPALVPIAIAVALATGALLRLVRVPGRLQRLAFAIPYVAMAALGLYALWRYVIPALT